MSREQDTKKRLLMGAMAEFAEKGYRGATLRGIAQRCGVAAALLIYHFKSKENLADEVIESIHAAMVLPAIPPRTSITSDLVWRTVLKAYVTDVIALFTTRQEPLNYLAPLYRHESASVSDKPRTLHDVCLKPIFDNLETIVALGVPGGDAHTIRLWSLALWNLMLAYALKDPSRIAQYVPTGFDPILFKSITIDFMLNTVLAPLQYQPTSD